MGYPDNLFDSDQLEPDQYGDRPDGADTFDAEAWTWITGLVRSITKRFFSHVRVSWSNSVAVVQEGIVVGDVLAIDMSQDATDVTTQVKIPYVAKYSTIKAANGTPRVVGVAVAACSALGKAQYANGGLLPQSITGLTSMAADAFVTVDATTNKLRAWVMGDVPVLGNSSPNGNVLLDFPAWNGS